MGLFRKNKVNPNKIYNISEALQIAKKLGEDYTLLEERTGYRVITLKESQRLQKELRQREAIKTEFTQRINGEGSYQKKPTPLVNYNDYQSAKRYGMVR